MGYTRADAKLEREFANGQHTVQCELLGIMFTGFGESKDEADADMMAHIDDYIVNEGSEDPRWVYTALDRIQFYEEGGFRVVSGSSL